MEDFGLFYGHLVYFTDIWYTLRTFGIFHIYLVYFPRFGMLIYQEKSGNPEMDTYEHSSIFSRGCKKIACRVTGWVFERSVHNVAQFLGKINTQLLPLEKCSPRICASFVSNFQKAAQYKQSPNRRKFVQSGANLTIESYNARVVNFYNATCCLARFVNKSIILILWKTL
jgi:hypothetical protein